MAGAVSSDTRGRTARTRGSARPRPGRQPPLGMTDRAVIVIVGGSGWRPSTPSTIVAGERVASQHLS